MARGIGGEIGWWCPSLDSIGNGTTTLTDLVGSNNGTLTNMDAATDWVADTTSGGTRALDFDGTNDHVLHPINEGLAVSLAGGITVSAWIYPTDISGGDTFSAANPRTVCLFANPSVGETFTTNYCIRLLGGKVSFLYRSVVSEFVVSLSNAAVLSVNEWQHIAAIHTGTAIRLYKNGVLLASTTTGNPLQPAVVASGRRFLIGLFNDAIPRYFPGKIDDVRVFNRAIIAGEVATLATRRAYQPPVGSAAAVHFFNFGF